MRGGLRRRAFALMVCLPVLALFSMLGTYFVTRSLMEAQAAANYTDRARARMLAYGGIQRAVAEIEFLAANSRVDSFRTKGFDDVRTDPWVCHKNGDPTSCGAGQLLEDAQLPSYASGQLNVQRGLNAQGQPVVVSVSISGTLGSTRGSSATGAGDVYTLKILDCASKLNLNSIAVVPQGAGAAQVAASQAQFVAVFRNLGQAITEEPAPIAGFNPLPAAVTQQLVDPNFWTQVFTVRQSAAFAGRLGSLKDLQRAGALPDTLVVLHDYATVHGFTETVLRPSASPAFPGNALPDGRGCTTEARAPVNVNTASRPVLLAVLAGVQGLPTAGVSTGQPQLFVGGVPSTVMDLGRLPVTQAIPYGQADQIARQILLRRSIGAGPLLTFQDLFAFLENPALGLLPDQVSALEANANPNALFCTWNPNRLSGEKRVDKANLTVWTTELCFGSMGWFEVQSLGRVVGPAGFVFGEEKLEATVKVFDVFRLTTQRDFTTVPAGGAILNSGTVTYPVNQALPSAANAQPSPVDGAITPDLFARPALAGQQFNATYRNSLRSAAPNVAEIPARTAAELTDDLVTPDGVRSTHQSMPPLDYATTGVLDPRQGSAELWVKLATRPTEGSDECLWMVVMRDPNGESRGVGGNSLTITYASQAYSFSASDIYPNGVKPRSEGVGMRLERFGTALRLTRFYWGFDVGAPSPYYYVFTERTATIDTWAANEWHHVAIAWRDTVKPPSPAFQEYGPSGEWDTGWWNPQTQGDSPPEENLRLWVDGRHVNGFFFRQAQNRKYFVDNPPEMGWLIRRCKLASYLNLDPSGLPLPRCALTGYQFNNPTAVDIYRTYRMGAGVVRRFANATIDDLRMFLTPVFPSVASPMSATSFAPPFRYFIQPVTPTQFGNAVDLGGLPAGAKVGYAAWTAHLASSWDSQAFLPNEARPQVALSYRFRPNANLAAGGPGFISLTSADASGAKVNLVRDRFLQYRFDFTFPAAASDRNRNVIPVLDDFSFSVLSTPKYQEFSEVPEG
ncbi:MAG: hypothetical protein HYZ53_10570 [Planctomycetes bacterium]|nr:hypothetical protein [Planctomycetota bacterium]